MFELLIASDEKHDKVFVEIYFHQKYIALLSQEKGLDALELEFPDYKCDQTLISREVPLIEFLNVIDKAKHKLIEE